MTTLIAVLVLLVPQIDENVVEQLTAMGFSANGCRRAVHGTGNTGTVQYLFFVVRHHSVPCTLPTLEPSVRLTANFSAGIEAAMNWIFEHQEDPGNIFNMIVSIYQNLQSSFTGRETVTRRDYPVFESEIKLP